MKIYVLIGLFFSILLHSQNSNQQVIKEKIKQLKNIDPDSKIKGKNIILLSNEIYHISKNAGYKKGMLTALLSQAVLYGNIGDTNQCLKATEEGLGLGKELKAYGEYTSLLALKAGALLNAGNYLDSRINFSRALEYSELIKDKDEAHSIKSYIYNYLVNYASFLDKESDNSIYEDSILIFAKKSYEESLQMSVRGGARREKIVANSAITLGQIYIDMKDFKKAEVYVNIGEKHIDTNNKSLLGRLYYTKGCLKFENGDKEKALEYYEKALTLSLEAHYTGLTMSIYESLLEYYRETKDVKNELYYLNKSKKLNDSFSKINRNALITQSRHDINLLYQQQSDNNTWKILLIASGGTLGALLSFYFYRKQRKKNAAIHIDTRVDSSKNRIDEDKIALLLKLARNNDKQFLIVFKEIYADLYKELLKFQELTAADLEMCAYLTLNIQTKEIATYKKISIGAVDNRKYRIRKKLNLLPETDLYKWIDTIRKE
ncbi:tetratricopeptide repeat protein [Chryseobacterium sp. SIMBA_028]|uniref:tetratricopeptide repeat protein n=2 Tax=Bacteria TaxID=2 RepID=UPI00397A042A